MYTENVNERVKKNKCIHIRWNLLIQKKKKKKQKPLSYDI